MAAPRNSFDRYPDEYDFLPLGGNTQTAAAQRTATQPQPYGTTALQNTRQQQAGRVTSDIGNRAKGWIGGLNAEGINASAAEGPYGEASFWTNYGSLGQKAQGNSPWATGGNIEAMMSRIYNPREAAAAANPGISNWNNPEDVISAQSNLADFLTQQGAYLDPAKIVGNTLGALQTGNPEKLAQVNPVLANILESTVGQPAAQIGALLSFLEQAMAGSMPADMLQSWISTLNRLGSEFARQSQQGSLKGGGNVDVQTFANFLTMKLGPTLGL
jgi:hypothetical protein